MRKQYRDARFEIALSSLSVLRFITDNITDIPLSVMTRILNTNDIICSLVHLIEKAPWMKRQGKDLMRYEERKWSVIPQEEYDRLSKVEAQIWIALYNLLVEPECRRKYEYSEYNQSIIMKVIHKDT